MHHHLPHAHRTHSCLPHTARTTMALALTPPLSLGLPLVSPPPTILIRNISYVMDEYGHDSPTGLMLVACYNCGCTAPHNRELGSGQVDTGHWLQLVCCAYL